MSRKFSTRKLQPEYLLPGLKKLKNIEGLTFFRTQGEDKILFVCDDGNKKKKQGAHYAIVTMREIKEKEKN